MGSFVALELWTYWKLSLSELKGSLFNPELLGEGLEMLTAGLSHCLHF